MQLQSQNKNEQNLDNNHTDSSYEQSNQSQQQYKPPNKNQLTQALYLKYQNQQPIKQQNQNKQQQQQQQQQFQKIIFKIKNLDTGQQQEIQTQDQGIIINQKVSQGLHSNMNYILEINSKKNISWNQFWKQVQKNNQKLKCYCQSGMYDQAIKIIKEGENGYPVEINYQGLDDWSPLHYAAYQGHDDIIDLLIENGANINSMTKFNRNSLHIATIRGELNVIKKLCKYKIDVNSTDSDGNTSLHFAAQNGYKEILQYFLSIYCQIRKNKDGLTPIDECKDDNIKNIFIQYGFKQNGNYDIFDKNQKNINKLSRKIISSSNDIKSDNFIYYKLLGKGSFGQVFLVKFKNSLTNDNNLYAMKVLSKEKFNTQNLRRYALNQRNVMSVIDHPFMVKLHYAFQSSTKLFLVMDYCPGGDLGKVISRKKNISQDEARKYIAELILAFQALHKNMIIFRDLKPDNVVLDSEGHCRLTDFGLSKQGIYNNTTQSFCGSIAYLAPEILTRQGHSRTVDWYLLGLLLYQLIVGLPPYYNSKKEVLFENIKRGPLKIPRTMSHQAKDLIKKLLSRDPNKRLGNTRDSQQLKQHAFFQKISWFQVLNRRLEMPAIQETKVNLNQSIKVSFGSQNQSGKKIQGWTFVGNH